MQIEKEWDLCSVKIEKEGCQFGEIKVGEYHTHPPLEIPPFPANIPSQQPAIVELKKMNDELEKYYYKFSP